MSNRHRVSSLSCACLLCLSGLSASAQELQGQAVKEKLEPLLKGKILRLASQGESAAPEFHVTIRAGDLLLDSARAAGRDLMVMRSAETGTVLELAATGWAVIPSLERPGWLEVLAGSEPTLELDSLKRSLAFFFAESSTDTAYIGKSKIEMGAALQDIFAGTNYSDVNASPASPGGWLLQAVHKNGSAVAFDLDPAAPFPFRSAAAVRSSGKSPLSMTFATGPAAVQPWSGITLEQVYALGLPVRVMQQARLQWQRASQGTDGFNAAESQKLSLSLMEPFRGMIESAGSGAIAKWPAEVKIAAARLATLCPPPLPAGVAAPPAPPENPNAVPQEPKHPLPGDQPVTVPLHRINSFVPVIDVEIDRKTHRFVLDTGATKSSISDAASAGATERSESFSHFSQDLRSSQMPLKERTLPSLRIGPWNLKNLSLTESEFGRSVHATCSGLIGCDMLSQHPFTLDWQARTLTFYPRAAFHPPAGAREEKITIRNGSPVASVTVPGWGTVPAMLDTGSAGHLVLKEPADPGILKGLRSWRLPVSVPSGNTVLQSYAWPADRPVELSFGRAPAVPSIEVSGKDIVQEYSAIAGTGILRHFRITFDLAAGKMWTESVPDKYVPPVDPNQPDEFGTAPLFNAMLSGGAAAVEPLLAAGAVITNGPGGHPARWAVQRGEPALAIRFMELDKDATWKKAGVLSAAVQTGQLDVLDWMLQHGVDLKDKTSVDAIIFAGAAGDVEAARRLRAAGVGSSADWLLAGNSAVQTGYAEFLTWLLKEDPSLAKATLKVPEGQEKLSGLLSIAAWTGQLECVRVLLAAGADPLRVESARDRSTALSAAAAGGRLEVLRLLLAALPAGKLKEQSPVPPLLALAITHPDCVQALLDAGLPPDAGNTPPLNHAALTAWIGKKPAERPALAQSAVALIRAGAGIKGTVTAQDKSRLDLVDLFAGGGLVEPLKMVLAKGLSPDGTLGALCLAAEGGEVETLRILLAVGADPARPGRAGLLPLWTAVVSGHTSCVRELLLTKKVNAKDVIPDDTGNTLPHFAARFNDPFLLQLLADAGAPLAASNKNDRTPLHEAIDRRALLAVRFLLSRGVKVKGPGLSPAEAAEYLTPKYEALQQTVKSAADKEGK